MAEQSAQQTQMQTPITLVLTVAQINGVLQAMHKAPYEMSQPLIEEIRKQAQAHMDKLAAQQAQPTANQVPDPMITERFRTPLA